MIAFLLNGIIAAVFTALTYAELGLHGTATGGDSNG